VLVDCPPKQVRLATQGDEHLIEVPRATRLAARRFHLMGKARAELLAPAANRLVADRHAALEQQLSMSRRLSWNRKYHRTAWLMIVAANRWP
jgi:hypothetical protein